MYFVCDVVVIDTGAERRWRMKTGADEGNEVWERGWGGR